MIYRLLRPLVRLAVSVFYRRIEVEGIEHVPVTGPVLLVPNHVNALVDPLIIVSQLHRPVTLTAKNILAQNRLLGGMMKLAGVVTFHRKEDVGKGADRRQNVRSLKQCREILAAGGAVCIFPEGVSHSDVAMRPFRLGPARLALDFARRHDAAERLAIVPVGILYTAKQSFRSDVCLRFGTPIDPAEWLQQGSPEALTEEIRQRVEHLTLDFQSRRESALLQWTSDIISTGGRATPQVGELSGSLSATIELRRRLRSGYRTLKDQQAAAIDELSQRIRVFRGELRRRGIAPEEVYLPMNWRSALLFVVRELELIVVGIPLALFGAITHALPALLTRLIARATSRDVDHWASNVIYPGTVIFLAYYVVVLTAAWLALSPLWAGIFTIALFYCGYYLLLMWDRWWAVFRRIRTFITFLRHPQVQARLADEANAIIDAVHRLSDSLPADDDGNVTPRTSRLRSPSEWATRIELDREALDSLLSSLAELEADWLQARDDIQARARGHFTPAEDDRTRALMLSFRNHRLALYDLIRRYSDYQRIQNLDDRLRGFLIGHAAAVSLYEKTLSLLDAYEHEPLVREKLNEPDARFGIAAGFFDELLASHRSLRNYRALMKANRFWTLHRRTLRRLAIDQDPRWSELCNRITSGRKSIRHSLLHAAWQRVKLGTSHLRQLPAQRVSRSSYRVRTYLGTAFADLRTTWTYRPAINDEVLEALRPRLETGDVLLMRSEPKVTSALLPGFWAHGAIYVGDLDELKSLGVPDSPALAKQVAELQQRDGRFGFVIEAIYAGVIMRPLGECLQADHVVCLRPRLPQEERRACVREAFLHFGKEYDFDFDFNRSSRLVCTDLVYRCINGRGSIDLSLIKRLGRFTLSADDLISQLLTDDPAAHHADVPTLVLCDAKGRAYFVGDDRILPTLQQIASGFRPARQTFPEPAEVSL